MAQFKVKKKESEGIAKATFNKAEDFKVVTMLKNVRGVDGKVTEVESSPKVLHVIQADRLIKKGKAKEVKGAKMEKETSTRTVTKID